MASVVVEISGDAADQLRALTDSEQPSKADIIGDALEFYVSAKRKLPTGAGKYHSGRSDVARNARALLRQAAEEGQWP